MKFDIAHAQSLGSRSNQEDRFLYEATDTGFFAVLCDGMGGMKNGEDAARIASEAAEEYLRTHLRSGKVTECLRDVIDITDEAVSRLTAPGSKTVHSGTTLVAAVVRNDAMYWLSVGDSRLYLIRGGQVIQATRDHNYAMLLNSMLKNGEIDADKFGKEQTRGRALVSYIGMGGVRYYDLSETPLSLRIGDVLILASDGLYGHVSAEEMAAAAVKYKTAQEFSAGILRQAEKNAGGNQDNATIISILCSEGKDETQTMQPE